MALETAGLLIAAISALSSMNKLLAFSDCIAYYDRNECVFLREEMKHGYFDYS